MEITSFAPNNFAPEKFWGGGGGGQICNDEYASKIPRMSISTALWKRSLTNAIIIIIIIIVIVIVIIFIILHYQYEYAWFHLATLSGTMMKIASFLSKPFWNINK